MFTLFLLRKQGLVIENEDHIKKQRPTKLSTKEKSCNKTSRNPDNLVFI
jgi:hypothetical protein